MLSQIELDWFAARLAIAVHDTNAEWKMSIRTLRQALQHIPGARDMTMRYGDGGRTQIFTIGEDEVEVGPDATAFDIEAALEAKKNPFNHPITAMAEIMTTIGEQLKAAKAQIVEARQDAANAVAESAGASDLVKQEVGKVLKEAADLRAELAELTNGGPA